MSHCGCFSFISSPCQSGSGGRLNQTEDQVPTEDTAVSGAECYLVNLVDPAFKIIVQVNFMLQIKD